MLFYLVSTVVAASVIAIIYVYKKKFYSKNQKLTWLGIVQLFNEQKLFPVESSRDWNLCDFSHGMRVFQRNLQLVQGSKFNISMYGCTTRIKGSATMVLSILKDSHRQQDWNRSACNVLKQMQMSPHVSSKHSRDDAVTSRHTSNSSDSSVKHDVIWLKDDVIDNVDELTLIVIYLTQIVAAFFTTKYKPVFRYWNREENGCCWLLEHGDGCRDWNMYLIQPTDGWFENDKCTVTLITSSARHYSKHSCNQLALRLACLRDHLTLRRIQRTPIVKLSTCTSEAAETPLATGGSAAGTRITSSSSSNAISSSTCDGQINSGIKDLTIIQKFKKIIDEKKEKYEMEKRKKASTTGGTAELSAGDKAEIVLGLLKISPANAQSNTKAAGEVVIKDASHATAQINVNKMAAELEARTGSNKSGGSISAGLSNELSDLETKMVRASTSKDDVSAREYRSEQSALRRRSQPAFVHRALSADRSNVKEGRTAEKSESRMTASGSQSRASRSMVKWKRTFAQEENVGKITEDLKAQADATVVYLLLEKSNVANLNISQSPVDQAKQTGGWVYCGLEKDIVILQKLHSERISLQSYLGKGIIPCPPKLVFETLKCPGNRLFYDEMLKTADVIHEFGHDMKIVHLYHEVSQLFKKECRDFCVLQYEKIEGMKYIVALQSVQWKECPDSESVIRAKMLSSGWVIEPVMRESMLHSMVTYISQIDVGRSKLSSSSLVDELVARQPLCIYNLRQYLASQQNSGATTTTTTTATNSNLLQTKASESERQSSRNRTELSRSHSQKLAN